MRNKFSHEDRQWDTNFFTQGAFKKDVADWYSLMAHVKYAYDYLHYLADPHKDESLMYTNNHYYQQEGYASLANRWALTPFWEVSLSADYQFNLLNADLTDFAYPRRHTEMGLWLRPWIITDSSCRAVCWARLCRSGWRAPEGRLPTSGSGHLR